MRGWKYEHEAKETVKEWINTGRIRVAGKMLRRDGIFDGETSTSLGIIELERLIGVRVGGEVAC